MFKWFKDSRQTTDNGPWSGLPSTSSDNAHVAQVQDTAFQSLFDSSRNSRKVQNNDRFMS